MLNEAARKQRVIGMPFRRCALQTLAMVATLASVGQALAELPRRDMGAFLQALGTNTIRPSSASLSTEAGFLRDHGDAIVGHRLLSDKRPSDPMATARRARSLFSDECRTGGGDLDEETSLSTQDFDARIVKPYIDLRLGVDYWRSHVDVCAGPDGRILGGFVAIVHDNSEMTTRGDAGSALLATVFGLPTTTAVYVFRPDRIATNAALSAEAKRRAALLKASLPEQEMELRRFHVDLKIGSETNCGTVIQVREPMLEVAVRPTLVLPRGQSTFWSRRERLFPFGDASCTFGL